MDGEETKVADTGATVFICVTCKEPDGSGELPPGRVLFDAVAARVRERGETRITVAPVECLAVCKRPCTVALAGTGKWTSVVGDLDSDLHADDVIAAALGYQASESGIIPWRQRPLSFRKGVVSRTPPVGFRLEPRDP
jgi:predicted metal-binding protein